MNKIEVKIFLPLLNGESPNIKIGVGTVYGRENEKEIELPIKYSYDLKDNTVLTITGLNKVSKSNKKEIFKKVSANLVDNLESI